MNVKKERLWYLQHCGFAPRSYELCLATRKCFCFPIFRCSFIMNHSDEFRGSIVVVYWEAGY